MLRQPCNRITGIILLFLIIDGCIPRHPYYFSFQPPPKQYNLGDQKNDSIYIKETFQIKGIAPVKEKDLLLFDKAKLHQVAETYNAKIIFQKDSFSVTKKLDTLKTSAQNSKDVLALEQELKSMHYMNKAVVEKKSKNLIYYALFFGVSIPLFFLLPLSLPLFIKSAIARRHSDTRFNNLDHSEFIKKRNITAGILAGILLLIVGFLILIIYVISLLNFCLFCYG